MDSELKPCPFCGGKATLHERTERQHFSAADAAHSGMGQSAGSIVHTIREVHCECGVRVGGFRVLELWNARAVLAPTQGETVLGIPVVYDESVPPGTFELRNQPKLIGWRTADYTYETADPDKAKNWSANVAIVPIFEGDPNTMLSAISEKKP